MVFVGYAKRKKTLKEEKKTLHSSPAVGIVSERLLFEAQFFAATIHFQKKKHLL